MSKDKAADYFSRHQSDECHITSDNRVFHSKGTADGFANGLKDKAVVSYTREQFESKAEAPTDEAPEVDKELRFKNRVERLIALGLERIEDVFTNAETGASINAADVYEITDEEFEISVTPVVVIEPSKEDAPKVLALESLKNFDASTATYEDAKAPVKALAIESPSQFKVDLFAAIEAQKVIINTEVQE
ncbi:hypothetical protein D3C85_112960 [compost metagenome]